MDTVKRTVTDKRVDQAIARLAKKIEAEYDKCCAHEPAGDEWFAQLDRAELKVHEMLAKRPISSAEITSIVERAFKALRKTLLAAKRKQPRYRKATNIETGVERLIPDDGE